MCPRALVAGPVDNEPPRDARGLPAEGLQKGCRRYTARTVCSKQHLWDGREHLCSSIQHYTSLAGHFKLDVPAAAPWRRGTVAPGTWVWCSGVGLGRVCACACEALESFGPRKTRRLQCTCTRNGQEAGCRQVGAVQRSAAACPRSVSWKLTQYDLQNFAPFHHRQRVVPFRIDAHQESTVQATAWWV